MATTFRSPTPIPALGMTSLVLGVIALFLAFLPVLGIPLSACGIVLGVVGMSASFRFRATYLRWALMGLATSCLALAINVAIASAPTSYLDELRVPEFIQPAANRFLPPPPARQGTE